MKKIVYTIYKCEYCDKNFTNENECAKHERNHIIPKAINKLWRCKDHRNKPIDMKPITLGEINNQYNLWDKNIFPSILLNANKNTVFNIDIGNGYIEKVKISYITNDNKLQVDTFKKDGNDKGYCLDISEFQ